MKTEIQTFTKPTDYLAKHDVLYIVQCNYALSDLISRYTYAQKVLVDKEYAVALFTVKPKTA